MKALLLCAGFGTRLLPYTKTTPKCLMPVNKKPLLQIWLEQLNSFGIGPYLINGHHLSEKLKEITGQDLVYKIHSQTDSLKEVLSQFYLFLKLQFLDSEY
mgnify:CR=1 FL=1